MSPDQESTGGYLPSPAKVLHPHPDAVAVMEGVRFSDLDTFLRRMERMCSRKIDWARVFGTTGILVLGATVGGAFGLFPFFAPTPGPSSFDRDLYFGLLILGLVIAGLCGLGRMATKAERVDSMKDLKEDFEKWMGAYREELRKSETAA